MAAAPGLCLGFWGTLVQSALESKYVTLFALCEAVMQHVA